MSYGEENGQVILTMSREDYEALCFTVRIAAEKAMLPGNRHKYETLLNRLNSSNPLYRPYQAEAKK